MSKIERPTLYAEDPDTQLLGQTIVECDPSPSGLVDVHGRPLVRKKQRIGFELARS